MYTTVIDEEDFAVKPMNCPGGMLVYKNEPHSYRDLPLRVGELGLVHRHELSGALHGLSLIHIWHLHPKNACPGPHGPGGADQLQICNLRHRTGPVSIGF